MTEEKQTMDDFMDEIEKSLEKLFPGDIVKAKVVSVSDDEIVVNFGYAADGVVLRKDLTHDGAKMPSEVVQPGDEISLMILKMDDGSGNVLLSKTRADAIVIWDDLERYMRESKVFKVDIKETVKGGLVADFKGVRVFIPGSQASATYVENLGDYVGTSCEVELIEYDKDKKKVVASRRVVEERELEVHRQKLWKDLQVGEKYSGKVTKIMEYGAFVDIGGLEGLVHISEMSWKRVMHPSEVVSEGETVEVFIIEINEEKGRVSLRLASVLDNPWNTIDEVYKIGDIVEGKVVRLKPFGAFVELEEGIEGLVHVSKISEERINKPADVLNIDDVVKVKIMSIDKEAGKLSLSIRDAQEEDVTEDYTEFLEEEEDQPVTLGDLFADKLKDLKF